MVGVGWVKRWHVNEAKPAIQRQRLRHCFERFKAKGVVAGGAGCIDGCLHQRAANALPAQRWPHIQPAHFGHAFIDRLHHHAAGDLLFAQRQQHCAFSRKLHELRIEAVESAARAGGLGQRQRCLAVFAQQQPHLIELKFVASKDDA